MKAEIKRQVERKYSEDYDVTINELEEGSGIIEIRMRDENGEYYYKHLTANEIIELVLDSYE